MDGDQRSHVWIKLALQAATQMDQILKDYPECMALPREAAASLWKMAKQYHVCTVALERQFSSEESRCLFQSGTFKVTGSCMVSLWPEASIRDGLGVTAVNPL